MLKKQETSLEDRPITPFTPFVTAEEHAALAADLAQAGASLSRVDGAAFGLAVSLNADPEGVVQLLDLEGLAPDLQERVRAYARAVWERVDADEPDLSLNPEVLASVPDVQEWMAGLTWGLRVRPYKLAALTTEFGQAFLKDEAKHVPMLVLSFVEDERLESLAEVNADVTEVREAFLRSMGTGEAQGRAEALQWVLDDLFNAYSVVNFMPEEVVENMVKEPMPLRGETFMPPVPVRREGRKIRPNEPCPCGSGKKYKKCHGASGAGPLP